MLVPVFFLIIIGVVIITAFISAFNIRTSGGSQPQHLRHQLRRNDIEQSTPKSYSEKPLIEKSEKETQQDEYDDFFKEYDDFFEQDDDPFIKKK